MRMNLPVTGKELPLRDGTTIVSKTDPRGIITYVNRDFVEVSGYSEAELIGQPHNLIRHPDMPPEAFADLWRTLKAGRPWIGLVKNRRKNGDHYWVEAQATPFYENGQVAGFMSVRKKPTREQVAEAERVYAAFRGNAAAGLAIEQGSVVRRGGLRRFAVPRQLSIRASIAGLIALNAAVAVAATALEYLGFGLGTQVAVAGLGLAAMAAVGYRLLGRIDGTLGAAVRAFQRMSAGQYDSRIDIARDDEVGKLLQGVQSMQVKLGFDVQEAQRQADAMARVQQGLDVAAANVMVADQDLRIVYLNQALREMFARAEPDIRKDLPDFSAKDVLGGSIDRFHRSPARQREMLSRLQGAHRTQIEIGGRTFNLIINPIAGRRGDRLGYVVEWKDRTAELAVESEIAAIVAAAAAGDFSRRVALEGKEGFFQQLAAGINQLLDTSHAGLNDVVRVVAALAQGDLTAHITTDYRGTFGKLKDDVNGTIGQLTHIVAQIKSATESINSAAREIAAGNADLSARTEQEAASLEETASTMEELTSTVKHNADNSRQANQLAVGASDIASKGGALVGQVVATMSAINEASRKIVDIIGVIDGIAFQTNILALNAAVEAARAGEQGRGFAVVASEVRTLAQRSGAAAKEIKTLIQDSVEKVDSGFKLVESTGRTMAEIVHSVKRVNDIMAEISEASQEQAAGIQQVNQTITNLDGVTQQNAALVEQATATARALQDQTDGLIRSVSRFTLSTTATQPATAVPRPAHPAHREPAAPTQPRIANGGAGHARHAGKSGNGSDGGHGNKGTRQPAPAQGHAPTAPRPVDVEF
ncbi:MAG: PAS domain-containing protein [Gammaproteobacteria bacterium]|nr:PAS domain-containing protein [Gammaproteobacteria bacterium]